MKMDKMEQCIICARYLVINTKILDCKHKFHKNCINEWFERQNTCPICRNDTTTPATLFPRQIRQLKTINGFYVEKVRSLFRLIENDDNFQYMIKPEDRALQDKFKNHNWQVCSLEGYDFVDSCLFSSPYTNPELMKMLVSIGWNTSLNFNEFMKSLGYKK